MTHRPSLTARLPASLLVAALACGGLWSAVQAQGEAAPRAHVTKNGVDVDLRSLGRQVADALAESGTLVGFGDRKSTRLNSSHLVISYAVFCLKKKKNIDRKMCAIICW